MSNGRPSRRRLSSAQSQAADTLGPLDGAHLPGGCTTCNAYQTVEPTTPGVWLTTIHHDPWCPTHQPATP